MRSWCLLATELPVRENEKVLEMDGGGCITM